MSEAAPAYELLPEAGVALELPPELQWPTAGAVPAGVATSVLVYGGSVDDENNVLGEVPIAELDSVSWLLGKVRTELDLDILHVTLESVRGPLPTAWAAPPGSGMQARKALASLGTDDAGQVTLIAKPAAATTARKMSVSVVAPSSVTAVAPPATSAPVAPLTKKAPDASSTMPPPPPRQPATSAPPSLLSNSAPTHTLPPPPPPLPPPPHAEGLSVGPGLSLGDAINSK